MSWQTRDLRRIRLPLIYTGLSLAFCGLVVGGAWWLRQAALEQQMQSDAIAIEAETRAAAAVADSQDIATYRTAYTSLQQRAVIGPEQRLPWVEYYTALSRAGNPADLSLEIAPRRPLEDPPDATTLENLQFYASKLTLDTKLLHEVDALRMLERLRTVQGAAIVRQCALKRSDGTGSARPFLLTMICEGDIITLDTPPTEAIPQ